MGFGVYLNTDHRWAGYGVPALCDQPDCNADIDRGLGYACGGGPAADLPNCGLFFCSDHRGNYIEHGDDAAGFVCERCAKGEPSFDPKPDTAEWIDHMLTDESWQPWRDENPGQVSALTAGVTP